MCGIFGAIDLSGNQLPFSDNIYSNALNAIKHRGPDDEGRWMNDNKSVFLGQRRLSIIAVSYTHLRAHETVLDIVCRLLLEKKNKKTKQ